MNKECVHAILNDNTTNEHKKAIDDTGVSIVGCLLNDGAQEIHHCVAPQKQ